MNSLHIDYLKNHKEHSETVNNWLFNEWHALRPGSTKEEWLNNLLQRSCQDNCIPITFIALENTSPVGTAALVRNDMKTKMDLTPWLAGVYVREDMRKKGIGRKLVQKVEEQARALHIKRLYLYTPDQMTFYAKQNWNVFEKTTYANHDVTIMYKNFILY